MIHVDLQDDGYRVMNGRGRGGTVIDDCLSRSEAKRIARKEAHQRGTTFEISDPTGETA